MKETFSPSCLCIIVPCYNEEANILPFIDAVDAIADKLNEFLASPPPYFIFIDDGSSDSSLKILRHLSTQRNDIDYISFSRNFGKEACIIAGLRESLATQASHVAIMDVDLQDPPSLLIDMYDKLYNSESPVDIVAAYRVDRKGESKIRSSFAQLFYKLINKVSNIAIKDGARDFRLITRRVVQAVVDMPERSRFSKGIFAWTGFNTIWIPYENVERERGSSSWSFFTLARYALDGIVAFSAIPLEFISVLGLIVFLIAVFLFVFIFLRAVLFGDSVAGWPSLACLVTLFFGLQFMSIGFLGLYISKIYNETKHRPLYLIAEKSSLQ